MIRQINILTIAAFVGASVMVAGCGIRGDLDTAPPMWGKAKQEYKAKKKADAQKEQSKKDSSQENSTSENPNTEK